MGTLDTGAGVPTMFINKLWKLVNDESSQDVIAWSSEGQSFTIFDSTRFAKEMLPNFFKHSKLTSFIRQLNMYGFRKIANFEKDGVVSGNEEIEFYHPFFNVESEASLASIKRNNSQRSESNSTSDCGDVVEELESIRERQECSIILMKDIQSQNQTLSGEVQWLKKKHNKQQQIIEKLLTFLVSIVSNSVTSSPPGNSHKRKAHLMIDGNIGNALKFMKLDADLEQQSQDSDQEDNEDDEMIVTRALSSSPSRPLDSISKLNEAFNDGSLKLALAKYSEDIARHQQPQASNALIVNNTSPLPMLEGSSIDPSLADSFFEQFLSSDL